VLTVVELDVVPVDEASNGPIDIQVPAARELSGGEPGRNRGMGYDVVTWTEGVH